MTIPHRKFFSPRLPASLVVTLAVLTIAAIPAFAGQPLGGAVFTTDIGCTGIDLNIYSANTDVYLQGGPDAHGNNPNPGSYYVQVTDPSGGTVLGTSVGGVVAGVLATDTPFVVDSTGHPNCFELYTAVMNNGAVGFAATTNPGGEYKVWVSNEPNFANDSTKTDNFKVLPPPPPPASISGVKFYDANVNGNQDSGEPGINGWWVDLYTLDPSSHLYSFTVDDNTHTVNSTDGVFGFDNLDPGGVYGVCEVIPSGSPTWVATTAKSAKGLSAPSSVNFGNVCLGSGRQNAVTLGFWSNKNGQLILTGSKTGAALLATYTFINSLNLKNASGGSAVPFASYAALQTFLLKATATNMAYMLSAQLATMEFNVASGNVGGTAIIYAPGAGFSLNSVPDFTTVNNLMATANTELGTTGHNYTISGSPYRSYQEALKNALDGGNNGNNFVQPSLSECTVAYTGGESCAP